VLFVTAARGNETMNTEVPNTKEIRPSGLRKIRSAIISSASGFSFANTAVDVNAKTTVSRIINTFFINPLLFM